MEENESKKYFFLILLILSLLGIIISITIGIKRPNFKSKSMFYKEISALDEKKLNEKQKKFMGLYEIKPLEIVENTEIKDTYTDEYKRYLSMKNKEKTEVIPRENEIPFEIIDDIKSDISYDSNIPSSFNLKDKINIKVENQSESGLCWDYASMKSLETYLSLNQKIDYDFSEIHVDYITSNLLYGGLVREVHGGGNFNTFKDYLKLTGPVLEKDVPFKNYSEEEYQNFIDMKEIARVTKTVDFPSIDSSASKEDITKFRNVVKNHIMKNGSLYAVIEGESINDNKSNTTEYCFQNCIGTHAISIVGWDDDYSKENFKDKDGNKPTTDGAYIALNSWGENWGNNGYFYISYEDKLVEKQLSGIMSTSLKDAVKISTIKSDKIKTYLKNKYNYLFINENDEEYISDLTLKSITSINMENLDLTTADLEELSIIFPNLIVINLSHNNITDISSINNFKNNHFLNVDLSYNDISDISILNNNDKITTLNLRGNKISDVSVINSLKNIYSVDLSENKINWTNNLSNKALESLNISDTDFKDINLLKKLEKLKILNISNNPITSLDGLLDIQIFDLDISKTMIQDFNLLNDCKSLKNLKVNDCNLNDISIFNGLNISNLSVQNNNITDISSFINKNINYIDLSNNNVSKGFENLKDAYSVILSGNNISSLDEVSKMSNVFDLDLSYNSITDSSALEKLEKIYSLSLEGNINIDISKVPKNISVLNLKNCSLNEEVDFSNFTKLSAINISNNNIKELSSLYNLSKDRNVSVFLEGYTLSNEEVESIRNYPNLTVQKYTANLNYSTYGNNKLKIKHASWLNKDIMRNILNYNLEGHNVKINKNAKEIEITGKEPYITIPYMYNVKI